jgi:hypothetical protein
MNEYVILSAKIGSEKPSDAVVSVSFLYSTKIFGFVWLAFKSNAKVPSSTLGWAIRNIFCTYF